MAGPAEGARAPPGTKTCGRGHAYDGPGGCPVCWKGNRKGTDMAAGKAGRRPRHS